MKAVATTWRVDPYSADDFPQLLALARRNLGNVDFSDESFCRWQYEQNPCAHGAVPVVAPQIAELAGIFGEVVQLLHASGHRKTTP